jgi:hypothetical protein
MDEKKGHQCNYWLLPVNRINRDGDRGRRRGMKRWRGGRVGSRERVCRRVGYTGGVEKEVAGGKAPGLSREKKHAQRDIEQCERRNQGMYEEGEEKCKGPRRRSQDARRGS